MPLCSDIVCNVLNQIQAIALDVATYENPTKIICHTADITFTFIYSWIARQLQVGRTFAFLLARSDFKPETSFGFLIPDYTGQST